MDAVNDLVTIGGVTYISSRRASEISGYSRDHIGYLARRGDISARQIGGNWYISELSLSEYKKKIDAMPSKLPTASSRAQDPGSIISLDGREYVSAQKGAELTGYHEDYVGQLCREGRILARRIGTRWFIEREALLAHRKEKNALLAAVQAEAVGLGGPRSITPLTRDDAGGPYMTYTRDDSDLAPIFQDKKELEYNVSRQDEIPISSHITDIRGKAGNSDDASWYSDKEAKPARKRSYARVAVTATTIVIVIAIGYISYGENAIYSYRSEAGSNYALATKTLDALKGLLDLVEGAVTADLFYRREIAPLSPTN